MSRGSVLSLRLNRICWGCTHARGEGRCRVRQDGITAAPHAVVGQKAMTKQEIKEIHLHGSRDTCTPNLDSVPVPVLSPRLTPCAKMSLIWEGCLLAASGCSYRVDRKSTYSSHHGKACSYQVDILHLFMWSADWGSRQLWRRCFIRSVRSPQKSFAFSLASGIGNLGY